MSYLEWIYFDNDKNNILSTGLQYALFFLDYIIIFPFLQPRYSSPTNQFELVSKQMWIYILVRNSEFKGSTTILRFAA